MLGVSSPSNVEDVHVDISLQRYCFSLLPYFWKMIARTRILVITQTQGAKNHNIVLWLRLWTPSQITPTSMSSTCKVYFNIYICCGCAYGCILTKLPLLTWLCFWKIARILVITQGANRTIVWWLRIWTHPRWLTHQCQTHAKYILPSTYAVDVHMDVPLQRYPCHMAVLLENS